MTDFIDLPYWPAFNVADIAITFGVLHAPLRTRRPAASCEAGDRELVVAPEHGRASGSTCSSRRTAGSRAAAQRLIDAGLVLVDGALRAEAPLRARPASAIDRAGRCRRRPSAEVPGRASLDDRLRRRAPAGGQQASGRGRASGARATRRARSPRRWRAARPAATIRDRAGHRAPPRPRHVRPARGGTQRGGPRGAQGDAQGSARITREYLALVEGRPAARTGTIDAPLGRDRRVRTRISTDTDDAARGGHALRDRARRFERLHAPAGAARDRSHAPDPRPPEGDRPPGRRRPGVRPRGRARPASASSCTPSAWRSRIR